MFASTIQQNDFINRLVNYIFETDENHILDWVKKMVKQNQQEWGSRDNCFLYQGTVFSVPSLGERPKQVRPLHAALTTQMDALAKAKKVVTDDKIFIRQMIFTLVDDCITPQDVRDNLPDCLVNYVPELKALPRDRPPAFLLADRPAIHRQYQRIYPTIQAYCATRLI